MPNTRRTSPGTSSKEIAIDTNGTTGANGDGEKRPLDLKDVLELHTDDGKELHFEVVGLVEDEENNAFAVCYNEAGDEFVVTDAFGDLLDDEELAQEILDDFFVLADETGEEPAP
jgi:hypothetical protein